MNSETSSEIIGLNGLTLCDAESASGAAAPGYRAGPPGDAASVQPWLASCVGDDTAMAVVRTLGSHLPDGLDWSRLSDDEVVAQLSAAVEQGRLSFGTPTKRALFPLARVCRPRRPPRRRRPPHPARGRPLRRRPP